MKGIYLQQPLWWDSFVSLKSTPLCCRPTAGPAAVLSLLGSFFAVIWKCKLDLLVMRPIQGVHIKFCMAIHCTGCHGTTTYSNKSPEIPCIRWWHFVNPRHTGCHSMTIYTKKSRLPSHDKQMLANSYWQTQVSTCTCERCNNMLANCWWQIELGSIFANLFTCWQTCIWRVNMCCSLLTNQNWPYLQ